MSNVQNTNNMGILNLASSMHYNDIFGNIDTIHKIETHCNVEIDHAIKMAQGRMKALFLSPWSYEVPHEQSTHNTTSNDINYGSSTNDTGQKIRVLNNRSME